jgi:hypothetical protein
MRKYILFILAASCMASILSLIGCKKTGSASAGINTLGISMVTPVSALCNARILPGDNSLIQEKGICWSKSENATVSDNKTSGADSNEGLNFTGRITGLTSNTKYFVRAYVNSDGTTIYGNELSFTTPPDHSGERGNVSDIDGNIYQTIGIGSQIWTASNLRTSRLNDGSELIYGQCYRCWSFLTTPGYCWYDNYEPNKTTFGALYNWYSVSSSKLCPSGWHVPDDEEWTILESYLGGESVTTGLSCLPGGLRGDFSEFTGINVISVFWTSGKVSDDKAIFRSYNTGNSELTKGSYPVKWGASVRCIKNQPNSF